MFSKYFNILLNIVFPLKCEVCGKELSLSSAKRICPSCWQMIEIIEERYCQKCGKPMLVETSLCVDCYDNDSLAFGKIRAAAVYRGAIREAIHHFKYSGRSCLGKELVKLLAVTYQQHFNEDGVPDYLIPVPLHGKQRRKREYNQTEILARSLSRRYNIPVLSKNLYRIRETKPQFELSKKERQENIKGAFGVREPILLKDKRILIIDDICTTGSTLNECARVLKTAGAQEVNALVLAHG